MYGGWHQAACVRFDFYTEVAWKLDAQEPK
jgi:hypothetical protein